jgi:PAS domain S-box-containing protein
VSGARESSGFLTTSGTMSTVDLLKRRVRELQLLHETGRRLTSLRRVAELLPEMVEQLRGVLGVQIVSIMLVDDDAKALRIEAAAGLPQDIVTTTRVPLGEGISGQVAARGEPVLIRDMAREPAFDRSPFHAQYTTESLICVPLRVGERVLGVINVNNKLSGEPLDDQDLAFVTTFSSQAVLALENARLYGNLQAEVERVAGELARSNRELRAAQEMNESILRNMSSGLVTLGLDGHVTKINAAAVSILGLGVVNLRRESLETLFGAEPAKVVLASAGEEGPEGRLEVAVRSRDGRDLLLGYSVSQLIDPAGTRGGLIVLFRDLTSLKRMEADLIRMDRMASLGVLGAGLAHEIRNPLAAIRFNLDFLREAGVKNAELDVIRRSVERLDDLVKKLLRFVRPQRPALAAHDLAPLADTVIALIGKQASASGVEVVNEVRAGLPQAWVDAAQVEQVVLNVALNGIQAMASGGRLVFRSRVAPAGAAARPCVELAISDDGPGLPPEKAHQVFDPFFTTREDGTGLGLAVAHRIMEDHGGYIRIAPPEPGSTGATFVLGFPVAGASAGAGAPGRGTQPPPAGEPERR